MTHIVVIPYYYPTTIVYYTGISGIISSTLIDVRLAAHRTHERELGVVEYELGKHHLDCRIFYPFGAKPPRELLGRSLADNIQLLIAEDLLRLYPGFTITHPLPGRRRVTQLRRLGIEKNHEYTLPDYVSRIAAATSRT